MNAAATRRRERLPSPSTLRREMAEVRRLSVQVRLLTKIALEGYEELYAASLSPSNADGERIPPGKAGFQVTYPTEATALSGMHRHMRSVANGVAHKLRKVTPILLEAEALIGDAFSATDPEFQEKLRRLREIEEEM